MRDWLPDSVLTPCADEVVTRPGTGHTAQLALLVIKLGPAPRPGGTCPNRATGMSVPLEVQCPGRHVGVELQLRIGDVLINFTQTCAMPPAARMASALVA